MSGVVPFSAEKVVSDGLTELGNSERLIEHYGENLHWAPSTGWSVWDEHRWRRDDAACVEALAKKTVRLIYQEAADEPEGKRRNALADHAKRSEKRAAIEAMIKLARSDPTIAMNPDAFDSNSMLLNCLNGTVDLRSGELRPHDRGDLITKLAPVDYDPEAECPMFERFLKRVLDDVEALVDFMQRAIGYSLTGLTIEQVLFVLHGIGNNGKSTLLEILSAVFGDYAQHTPMETFTVRRDGNIPNDVARLKGARLVSAAEIEDGKRLAVSLVKQMTGSDKLAARFMRQEWFEFAPEFKVFLAVNHKPQITDTTPAIWRRVRLIPFEVVIPKDERDKHLVDKLKTELPGILAWSVRGCLAWQQRGLEPPQEVVNATQVYRSEMDTVGVFLSERTEEAEGATVGATPLYQAYKRWTEQSGEATLTQKQFGSAMTERGIKRRGRPVVYVGIRLVDRTPGHDSRPDVPSDGDPDLPLTPTTPHPVTPPEGETLSPWLYRRSDRQARQGGWSTYLSASTDSAAEVKAALESQFECEVELRPCEGSRGNH